MAAIVVGIAGGTGAGKSTFVQQLCNQLANETITIIPQDAYYHDNSHLPIAQRKRKNFDHPDAVDWDLLAAHIALLQKGEQIHRPVYSMLTCTREAETVCISPGSIILLEGILIFTQSMIRDLCSLKIFIDADLDVRYKRVLQRDMEERGRNDAQVSERFYNTVQPMHDVFIEPAKKFADIIVSGGGLNAMAVHQVSERIKKQLSFT